MEYEPPDKTAVKLPELEDILSPPIPVNESQPWNIPKFGLTGIPSGISNKSLFQDKDGSVNTIKSIISKDRFKPLLPKLPVRIRGLEKLYQKIEPVKIDYGKYLIEPAEKTISGFIKPLGSGLKGGFLKTMLSFLPDTSKISLPLGNIGSSGFFKSLRSGFRDSGGLEVLSTLGMLLGGKEKILGSLFGKGGFLGGLPGKFGPGGIFGGGRGFGGGGIPGGFGIPGAGFDKIPACPFTCPLLKNGKVPGFPGEIGAKKDDPPPPWIPTTFPKPEMNAGLESFKTIREMYDKLFGQIIGGNDEIMASFASMFRKILEQATGSFDRIGRRSTVLCKDLYSGLADYTVNLGAVSGYASRAFAAFRTLNPFGAAAASFGLMALGQMLRSLSSGGAAPALSGSGGGSSARLATADAGGISAESTWSGPQVVNVYIDGMRSGSVYEVDRSLDRAGLDRELRNRIRELVRTGSNPTRTY